MALRPLTVVLLTVIAMLAFAANSVLARLALAGAHIDAASFTTIRLLSGALMLWALVWWQNQGTRFGQGADVTRPESVGHWRSALALFVYAAGFSFAYLSLATGTGALLLFGAVQATMIGAGLKAGERLSALQLSGLLLALAGLLILLLPGSTQPSLTGALLMLSAGCAWGLYSLWGKGAARPLHQTTSNFSRALPFGLLLSLLFWSQASADSLGVSYAILSGALTSALGYAVWYRVLPNLRSISAATVQLSVPVIATLGGAILLGEAITVRLLLSGLAILGGILLVIWQRHAS